MIRDDQQRRRLRERRILVEQRGIDVAVRADKRQLARLVVKRSSHVSNRRIGIEEPILVQDQRLKVSALQGASW